MKQRYIDLMEKALSAYTTEHVEHYFDTVKRDGLIEHGFPRLTANIGILLAHGRRTDLTPLFVQMMELCCRSIPTVRAANNFSVREMISCISEIEDASIVDQDTLGRWKGYLSSIVPDRCYELIASSPTDKVKNWALFAALSEFFRMKMGLGGSMEWIETQIATQLVWLDENGMYMDGEGDVHHPMMYDVVARGLFALLLNAGYRGRYYREIDDCLRRSGLFTLKMQSPNGEMAFGGRSNQFLHNEPWVIAILEYEAARYAREGDYARAEEFKSACLRALNFTEKWHSYEPIRHIKNRFEAETRFGCEEYAYFDKYMITVASNIYVAYLLCDEGVETVEREDVAPAVFETSEHFHKLFLKAGGYGLEFDFNADHHYDASGLGRLHRAGAPSQICLSVPCPENPKYRVGLPKNTALSMACALKNDGEWALGTSGDAVYELLDSSADDATATATVRTGFADGSDVITRYTVGKDGVEIEVSADGEVGYMLPAFYFDGENYTRIRLDVGSLSVSYNGWTCRYMFNGTACDLETVSANRNGYYKAYFVSASEKMKIKVEIVKL